MNSLSGARHMNEWTNTSDWKQTLEEIELLTGTKAKKLHLKTHINFELYEFLKDVFDETVVNNVGSKTFENILAPTTSYIHISDYAYKHCKGGSLDMTLIQYRAIVDDIIRLGSTNECSSYIQGILKHYDELSCKWLIRGVLKDLRLGIKLKSINEVLIETGKTPLATHDIVQLCEKLKVVDNKIQKLDELTYPVYSEKKVDGVRLLATKSGSKVELMTRNGKILTSFPEIEEALSKLPYESFVLDGEVMSDDYYKLMTRTHRKKDNLNDVNLFFVCWDILKFGVGYTDKLSYLSRTEFLHDKFNAHQSNKFKLMKAVCCNNSDDVQSAFETALDEGYEGIVIKQNAPYIYARSKFWLKAKPNNTADLLIVGYECGTGKYSNVVSSLSVQDASKTIQTDVGTGLTDELREHLTKNEKTLIGKIVEVKYDSISKERSLRFPRIVSIRDDKDEPDNLQVS